MQILIQVILVIKKLIHKIQVQENFLLLWMRKAF